MEELIRKQVIDRYFDIGLLSIDYEIKHLRVDAFPLDVLLIRLNKLKILGATHIKLISEIDGGGCVVDELEVVPFSVRMENDQELKERSDRIMKEIEAVKKADKVKQERLKQQKELEAAQNEQMERELLAELKRKYE